MTGTIRTLPWPILPRRRVGSPTATPERRRRLRARVARALFRKGADTVDIARVLGIGEPEAARLLAEGRLPR